MSSLDPNRRRWFCIDCNAWREYPAGVIFVMLNTLSGVRRNAICCGTCGEFMQWATKADNELCPTTTTEPPAVPWPDQPEPAR